MPGPFLRTGVAILHLGLTIVFTNASNAGKDR